MLALSDLLSVWLSYVVILCLGLCVGSFLNVVIYRLPLMMQRSERAYARELLGMEQEQLAPFNLFKPNSHCPNCGHPIRFWENIPLISYFVQKGRCTSCWQAISCRYPIIEALCGVLSVLVALQCQTPLLLLWVLLFTWCLIALTAIDFDEQLLPDVLTLPLMWLGIAGATFHILPLSLFDSVVGAMAGYLILWSVYWLFKWLTGKEGMGYGDFKLLAALGAWAGALNLPAILLLSTLLAIMYAVLVRIRQGQAFSYGPFLAIAGWLMFMYGRPIQAWWFGLF